MLVPESPLDAGAIRTVIGEPTTLVVDKQLDRLDRHARAFIAASPMVVLATADAAGACDASPRGDPPGFARVLDDRTLLLPDRKGNRRVDSLRNIAENPRVGLLFIVPGTAETVRVNGRAAVVDDAELLAASAVDGRAPQLGILVTVEEVFFHCARAFLRARLWEPSEWRERGSLPSLGTVLRDHTDPRLDAEALDEELARDNSDLY